MNYDMGKKGSEESGQHLVFKGSLHIFHWGILSLRNGTCMLKHLFRFQIGSQIRSQLTIIKVNNKTRQKTCRSGKRC